MPKLTITYKDNVVFDGEVSEFSWTENATSVMTKARIGAAAAGMGAGSGGGLMNILERAAANQKGRTATRAQQLRVAPVGEPDQEPDMPDDGDSEDPVAKRNTPA